MSEKQNVSQAKRLELSQKLQQAISLYQQGRFDPAAALFLAIVVEEPGHVGALHMLGAIHYQQGQFDKALGYAQAVLDVEPDNFAALSALGLIHATLGNAAEALTI
jgi:Flp pilus assembly protein TadD